MTTPQTSPIEKFKAQQSVDLRGQLEAALNRNPLDLDSHHLETLLSAIYRQQAEVIDPSEDALFILWKEFKFEHQAIFAKAFAKLMAYQLADANVGAIIGVPDSATWLLQYLKDYFPDAQYPQCIKTSLQSEHAIHTIDSLTYTQRDAEGNRLPLQLSLEAFDVTKGQVLVIEDIIAKGESGMLFLKGLQGMGVGSRQVVTASVVEMPQGGRSRLEAHPLTAQVYAPIVVTGVTGKGFGQIKTIK